MKDNKEKSFNDIKVKKPSFFLYWIPLIIVRFVVYLKWHHRVDRKELRHVKGPILAIANHCSTMDIVFSLHALLPRRYNVVTSKELFTWKPLKPFIKKFGAIPKNQCSIDITSLKLMKKALESNNNVLIYPEGRTSVDGKQLSYLAPSIAKFIKMMDTTVAFVRTDGAYLTKPRWFKGFRWGKVHTKTYVLLTVEEVRSLPNKVIYEKVKNALIFNDNIWQRENNVRFKSKNIAKHMEYILYKCPKCGVEYEMSTEGNRLRCNACGNEVEYTEYGELKAIGDSKTIDRIDLWYDYCRQSALEEIKKEDFYISKKTEFWLESAETKIFEKKGEGEFYMDKKHIGYNGTMDGKPFEFKQLLQLLPTLITKNEEGIDLVENDRIYRFLFVEKKWSAKYGLLCEQLFAYNNNLLDT